MLNIQNDSTYKNYVFIISKEVLTVELPVISKSIGEYTQTYM